MDQVRLYAKNNNLQRTDASYVIDNFLRLVKWKKSEKEKILDIGAGDGSVTLGLLLPRLPSDFGKLIGCDVSSTMVEYAKKQCKDSRIEFLQMDIQGDEVPIKLQQEFDHIFSFYCLHWIQNQRRNVVRPAQAILNYDQIKLYGVNNGLQKRDAKYAIDRYLPLMNFDDRRHETLLDIGSGDGGILHEFLLPKLPTCVKEVVGSDFSQLMINYAKEHAGVDFILLDIQGDDIPGDFKNYFNHVFSHYCLHWVQNQRQAFKNIYNLMAPGGDVLLVFLASNPIYDIYNTMGNTQKWMPFMPNYKKYISPYHFSSTPIQDLESILNGEGFSIHLCRLEDRNFAFPNIEALEKATKAVNPFIKSIPEDLIDEYLNDFVEEVRKLDCVKIYSCENNNESKITFTYQLFIVFASKPDKK